MVVEGNGTVRLYDPIADTFVVTRTLAVTALRGTASAAPDGSFYAVDNTIFNSVLVSQGSLAPPPPVFGPPAAGTLAFGVTVSGNSVIRVQEATAQTPVQSLQRYNLATLQPNLQVLLPERVMDIAPALIGLPNGTRQWPPRITALELGVNNQTQLLPRGMVMDAANNAYLLTLSGLTVVSLTSATGAAPSFSAAGVINTASRTRQLSPGSLVTIQGNNLALSAMADGAPLPRSLGGICVTANEIPIPLISTSPTQIEAQLPNELPPGRITLTVRSTRLGVSSLGAQIPLTATAPALFAYDIGDGERRAAMFHAVDGALVIPIYPAERDEVVVMYATGLGPADPSVPTGVLNPDQPISPTRAPVSVSIGGVPYVVLWSGLAPGFLGVYQIHLYVPGDRARGENLPVVVTAGDVSSDSAPVTSID
jgi:uncharacterized protein (TIGR03437 family)